MAGLRVQIPPQVYKRTYGHPVQSAVVDKTQFTSFGASDLVELITHKEFRMMLLLDDLGAIAQLVEQQVEALCVGGSIPPCAIQ